MGWDLQLYYHPAEQAHTQRKCPEAQQFFESIIADLSIVEQSHHEETVNGRVVFDETSGSHVDNSQKLGDCDKAKDKFLQAHLDMTVVESLINPNDDGVVYQVEEEEVEQHGFAYL